ncbi:hypothetical protein F511_32589 [Dorcoceras hygrometricum]|uniref:Splicing factor 3B subunit 1-like n=1 Tax=Dorcoceras hygrometricum TaxID=472368 RepID=A0A2Z7CZW7_9LAMI|nr:hypothetical protein F511_32589 [Dorcoceras hygrometricum]
MKYEFLLLNEILEKSVTVKEGSFDAVTHERLLLMTAIHFGVKVNLSKLLFDILKEMTDQSSKRAKGYVAQICVLLKGDPNLTLGEAKTFPPIKILTVKTVGTYVSKNKNIADDETNEPVVATTVVVKKKEVSKRRPGPTADEPIAKKKRITVGRAAPADKNLTIVTVAQDVEPISTIPAVTPRAQRRRAPKRKLVMQESSDDEIVDNIIHQVIADTAKLDTGEPDSEETMVVKTVGTEPVETESRIYVSAITTDDPTLSSKVLSNEEKMEMETETEIEKAKDKVIEPAADQGLSIEKIDSTDTEPLSKVLVLTEKSMSGEESMSIDDILKKIPEEMMLPSTMAAEPTKIKFGLGIGIPGVNEWDWYKASLPQIAILDKGKPPLVEKDERKGHLAREMFSLICADIDFLVQLRERVVEDVASFFHSFSLRSLAVLDSVKDIFAKEEHMLAWDETDSLETAVKRRMYIVAKYRELLLQKFLEARHKNFESGTPSTAIDLQIQDLVSNAHRFSMEEMRKQMRVHKVEWTRRYSSKLFEGAKVDRGAVIARSNTNTRSTCWIRRVLKTDGSWKVIEDSDRWIPMYRKSISYLVVVGPVVDGSGIPRRTVNNVQYFIRIVDSISKPSIDTVAEEPTVNPDADSTSSSDSQMHFIADDIPLGEETAAISIPIDFTGAFAQLQASVDQISLEQVQSKFHLEKLKADLSKRISHLETALITTSENQDRATLVQIKFLQKEMQDHKAALSTDLDVFRKEVEDQLAALSNDLMEFRVQAQENYNTLTTQLSELVDYINRRGSRTPQNPLPMINTLSSVSVRESRIQYLCDPQWFRDTASRGPTTIVAPESQFRTCPTDHDSIGYPRMSASGEFSTTMHRLLHASGSHPIPPPNDPKTNQYNQDLGLIHSPNGNHLESPNEGSSIDHQVTIYLHAQNITMFPTNEIWYFASQILVSISGGLILILTAQSTRN